MNRITGILLIAGSLLFIGAAMTPVAGKVWGTSDKVVQLEAIENNRTEWTITNVLFGVGSVVAAAGFVTFAQNREHDDLTVRRFGYVAAAAAVTGALVWVIISYERITRTPSEIVNDVNTIKGLFPAYTLLTQIGLLAVAYVLYQGGYPRWLAVLMALFGGVTFIVYIIIGDMPPGVYYLPMLVMGITLLLRGAPAIAMPRVAIG